MDNTVEIFLPGIPKPVLVDIEDMSKVMRWPNKFELAGATSTKQGSIRLWMCGRKVPLTHIILFGKRRSVLIDHIDRNPYNNTRNNLRLSDDAFNAINKVKTKKPTSSKFMGVYFNRSRGWWIAQGSIGGKAVSLGKFKTQEEAAKCRDVFALKHYGEHAVLNFPKICL